MLLVDSSDFFIGSPQLGHGRFLSLTIGFGAGQSLIIGRSCITLLAGLSSEIVLRSISRAGAM